MNERERIIDTIKKCLALGDTNRNPNEHEAETAIRQAKTLMDKYNLSMADVAATEEQSAARLGEARTDPWSGMPQWAKDLGHVCNALFSTYCFYHSGAGKTQIVFCGDEVAVALSVEVFKLLRLEMYALAGAWERKQDPNQIIEVGVGWDTHSVPFCELSAGMKRTRKFKYMEGVSYTLGQRARQMSEDMSASDQAKVTALVVRRSDEAREWARAKYSLSPAVRRNSGMHGDAVRAGLADGRNVNLNFNRNIRKSGGSKPLQLGDGK